MIKFIVEVLLAIFLHPVAFVLAVIDIVNRKDMGGLAKFLWIIIRSSSTASARFSTSCWGAGSSGDLLTP